jgi:hypothetical protein
MPVPLARREFAKVVIDSVIRKALATLDRKPRRAFDHLLENVQARSELLRPSRYVGRNEGGCSEQIVGGLLALVGHRKHWLRPVEAWRPSGGTAVPMFSSLAHHLLANYPVPPVLLSAWFGGTDREARCRQGWFRHAGLGRSLRTAGFPLRLTRGMAHEFAHAPADLPIEFAFRWAKVRGLGGSDGLARAVAATRLGRDFDHEEFWTTVIHLFINTPRLDPGVIEPIIEYLHDQRFEFHRAVVGEDTEVYLDPPQPDLSVKGRTVASLMKQVEQWRSERRRKEAGRRVLRWERSGIGEYRRRAGDGRAWTIRELLDGDGLAEEGKAMQHCVATYTGCCLRGTSTIWSLGLEGDEGRERLVTIEVDPKTREVVQAKARCNEKPDEATQAILAEWAVREGLELGG